MRYGGDYWLRHIRCHLLGYRILRHKEGLGYGDVKFLAALGARHARTFLPRLVFLAASFACGAVVVGLLMRGKESLKPAAVWAISGGCGFRCRLG